MIDSRQSFPTIILHGDSTADAVNASYILDLLLSRVIGQTMISANLAQQIFDDQQETYVAGHRQTETPWV